jgi:hypothetical protein
MIPFFDHKNTNHTFLGTFLEKNNNIEKYWDLYLDGKGLSAKLIARYGNEERDWESVMVSMLMQSDFDYYPFKIARKLICK